MKKVLRSLFEAAYNFNVDNIVRLARGYNSSYANVCDLGAGDGVTTTKICTSLGISRIHTVESHPPNVSSLKNRGITVFEDDLNGAISGAEDASFDLVLSNQVIEHLYDTDILLSESARLLRPGGIVIVSTENLASWHNIAALLLGWQPFSLTNVSAKAGGVGNPFAFYSGEDGACFPMQHHRLFTTRALVELLKLHGFRDIRTAGSGYYPLPAQFGNADPNHAHFIAAAGRKSA